MDLMVKVRNLATYGKNSVRFDVNSLFTSVPLDDVLDFLEGKLSSSHKIPFPVNYFIDLIRLCVFTFDGEFHKQIYGIAIGRSPKVGSHGSIHANLNFSLLNVFPHSTIWFRNIDIFSMNHSSSDDLFSKELTTSNFLFLIFLIQSAGRSNFRFTVNHHP